MQLRTILNQCYKYKCFVFYNGKVCLEVDVVPRRNSKAVCSCCGKPAPLSKLLKRCLGTFSNPRCIGTYHLVFMRCVEKLIVRFGAIAANF